MGKRSNFERIEKDDYRTIDPRAVDALLRFVPKFTRFAEPCAGSGDLACRLMLEQNICTMAMDLSRGVDAMALETSDLNGAECIITNPPWTRKILHSMIEHFVDIAPFTWLLFDSDWAHTKQSAPYMKYCSDIVSVGRLIWIPGTTTSGKDNCAWYRFSHDAKQTIFHGR